MSKILYVLLWLGLPAALLATCVLAYGQNLTKPLAEDSGYDGDPIQGRLPSSFAGQTHIGFDYSKIVGDSSNRSAMVVGDDPTQPIGSMYFNQSLLVSNTFIQDEGAVTGFWTYISQEDADLKRAKALCDARPDYVTMGAKSLSPEWWPEPCTKINDMYAISGAAKRFGEIDAKREAPLPGVRQEGRGIQGSRRVQEAY